MLGLAREVRREVEQLASFALRSRNEKFRTQATRAMSVVAKLEEKAVGDEAESARLLEELEMLRVLASMGILVGEVVHELRPWVAVLERSVSSLRLLTDPHALTLETEMSQGLSRLRTVLSYVERVFAEQATRETRVLELRDVLRAFVHTISEDAKRSSIELIVEELDSSAMFTPAMHDAEWAAVLFNLYTNAKKAIRRGGDGSRILFRVGRVGKELFLEVADSGIGIPVEDRERIFQPFYTTSRLDVTDGEVAAGLGLGLSITRDIVLGYSGKIRVVDAPSGYRTAIRLWIPETPLSEVPDSAY